MNRAARAAVGCLSAPVARKRVARAAGLRRYETEIRTRRGHCRARGCASRLGVVRVTVDVTGRDAIERAAHVECVQCGRTWYRVASDTPVTRLGYLSVLVTLIAPSGAKRVIYRLKSNGATHAEGDDSVTIVNATLGQLSDAVRVWNEAHAKRETRKAIAREKREATALADREATRAFLARIHEREQEHEAEERAAIERERRGQS